MSAPTRKPLASPGNPPPTRIESSPSRRPTANTIPTSTGQGLARNPSLRQQRPARKAISRQSNSFTDQDVDEDEAKAANVQLISDLREQVGRAEQASEQYRKQLDVMKKRMDELDNAQTSAEERDYSRQTEIDRLKAEVKDLARQRREIEVEYEADKKLFLQEHDRRESKEKDLEAKVQRLNETLRTKGTERLIASRSGK
jgi:uncharacterized protein YhaN